MIDPRQLTLPLDRAPPPTPERTLIVSDATPLHDLYENYRKSVWLKGGPTGTLADFAARMRGEPGVFTEESEGVVYVIGFQNHPQSDREKRQVIYDTLARNGYQPRSEDEFFDQVIALKPELLKLGRHVRIKGH